MVERQTKPNIRVRAQKMDEKALTIPQNKNSTAVRVSNHRWVAIYRGNEEIMRDESPGGAINFQLPPGDYTVRTDGSIDAVTFETVERPAFPGMPGREVSALDKALIEGKPIGRSRPTSTNAPKLGDLPPDLIKRLLRYAEVNGAPGLDSATVNHIVETGELPDHVSLPPDFVAGVLGLDGPPAVPIPPPPEVDIDSLPVVLDVAVEAPGVSPVDGVPEVPADGKAFCTINLAKMTVTGQVLNRAKDTDEVYLRATGGQLVNARGKLQHKLQLNKGKASFRLMSETTPRFVTVSIFSPTLQKVDVHIDFVPAG
jgi:hypothetical protein